MPSAHRRFADWTPGRIRCQAAAVGPNARALVDIIMRESRSVRLRPTTGRTVTPHPEQGFHSSIGILRLAKAHGNDRLEAACVRALEIGARSYSSVASILKNNLDRRRPPASTEGAAASTAEGPAIEHPNIRNPRTFH
jgi:transposase